MLDICKYVKYCTVRAKCFVVGGVILQDFNSVSHSQCRTHIHAYVYVLFGRTEYTDGFVFVCTACES